MGKEIRIIKKGDHKKFEDYTFVDNNNSIELNKIDNETIAIIHYPPMTKRIEEKVYSSLGAIQRRL
jgi:hypothetical protein